MPIYTYACSICNNSRDEIRRINERDRPSACPSCGMSENRAITSALFLKDYGVPQLEHSAISCDPNGSASTAIYIDKKASNTEIHDCYIRNFDIGISLPEESNTKITKNKINNCRTPIKFRSSE